MFCNNCGKELADGSAFCPYCGTKQLETQQSQPQPQPVNQNQNQYQTYNYIPMAPSGADPKEIDDTKTLGIVAIVVGIFIPLVGFICGGIGLSKSKKLNAVAFEEQKAQINKNRKLCLAGIIVSAVLTVISVIISVIIGATLGKMIAEGITKNIDNGTYSYSYNSDEIPDNVEDYLNQYGIEIEN